MEIHREHRPEGAPVSGSSPSSQLLRLHEVLLWAACLCHANGGKQVVSPGLWGARGEGRPADGEQPQRRTLEPRAPPATHDPHGGALSPPGTACGRAAWPVPRARRSQAPQGL